VDLDGSSFRELQLRLRDVWPALTIRTTPDVERTSIVVHSVSLEVPERMRPVLPAYEERFLFYLLSLLTGPRSRLVYVTSQPILPRLINYWFSLVPALDTAEVRSRLTLLPLVDARPVPLTRKLLDHPGALQRIQAAVADPALAVILPFVVTPLEAELSIRLGIPVLGPDPALAVWGTKRGSRRAFRETGSPHPDGVEGVARLDDVVEAIDELRARQPLLGSVIVKLDEGVNGFGIGTISLKEGHTTKECAERIVLEDPSLNPDGFYATLGRVGGVVEERLTGEEVRSPSVQLRASPSGEVEVVSTHEQVLGGPNGLSYHGCRMPAEPDYSIDFAAEAVKVGELLAREGVIGRFAIDFVAVRQGSEWSTYAVEINLRNGGTTHPLLTLMGLTDGAYEPSLGVFHSKSGTEKRYVATDHLHHESYARLTTDDFLDILPHYALGWDNEHQTGAVFHLASAIGGMGIVGITAVGDTTEEADAIFSRARAALDQEAARLAPELPLAVTKTAGKPP
jgi:hypothetical protein